MPNQVQWSSACEGAFEGLKDTLVKAPVLAAVDPEKAFILQTDASKRGLGAVLSQVDAEGKEHPISYASRKLLPRECNYATVEKECLAVVWALKIFHTYLWGRHFTIQTDHQPLTWLHRMKNNNARLIRWSLAIQPYSFTVSHRCGSASGNADGLSRGPTEFGLSMMEGGDKVTPIPSS